LEIKYANRKRVFDLIVSDLENLHVKYFSKSIQLDVLTGNGIILGTDVAKVSQQKDMLSLEVDILGRTIRKCEEGLESEFPDFIKAIST